jgi:hypothetical protein
LVFISKPTFCHSLLKLKKKLVQQAALGLTRQVFPPQIHLYVQDSDIQQIYTE